MITWLLLLTICLPWLGALVVWLAGEKRAHTLAVLFALGGAAASLMMFPLATDQVVLSLNLGRVFGLLTFVPDSLGVFLANIATVIGGLAVFFSVSYMKGEAEIGRYYALVLLFIGAMVGLVFSGSLFAMFIFWEMTALCSYALISFDNDNPKAVAGGLKALVITQLGGVGLLVGALVTYGYLGDYQVSSLLARGDTLPPVVLSVVAFGFLLGAMAKSAQVPLHTWLPDAMEAPTPVSALIHAATMVNAGVYLLIRFYPLFALVPGWKTAVLTVGLLSALLSAMMALTTPDLKRVLAYSTISQLGYMVYAVGSGAVFAATLHLFSHAIFKALLFLAAGAIIHTLGTRDMQQMGGVRRQMPFVTAVFLIGAAALAGLPLFNGFFSKELILEGGLVGSPGWAYAGMVTGVGLTALYTSRMVWWLFAGDPRGYTQGHEAPMVMRLALAPLAAGVLVSGWGMGEFGRFLAATLPFHHLEHHTTLQLVADIARSSHTWLSLVVILLGGVLWWQRQHLAFLADSTGWLHEFSQQGFGFEWLNQQVVAGIQRGAAVLQTSQTGQLNWNILGVVVGLVVVLWLLIAL